MSIKNLFMNGPIKLWQNTKNPLNGMLNFSNDIYKSNFYSRAVDLPNRNVDYFLKRMVAIKAQR